MRLIAPGCDLDGADPTTGTEDYNYWQVTSEASVITAAALDALYSYQPGLSLEAGEKYLTEAQDGVLNIDQSFRNAGLQAVVSSGEAAEPRAAPNSTTQAPTQSTPLSRTIDLTRPFAHPQARLVRIRHRLALVLRKYPEEAEVQVRYLGRHEPSRRLRILRTLYGVFRRLMLPPSGVAQISVRYIDPYDSRRASPWTTLKLPSSTNSTRKGRHGP